MNAIIGDYYKNSVSEIVVKVAHSSEDMERVFLMVNQDYNELLIPTLSYLGRE